MDRPRRDIERRTFELAVAVLKLVRKLPRDVGGQVVARQLARSASSVGSNVEEAQGAQTKSEFARRMNIALSEARESHYWLKLALKSELLSAEVVMDMVREANELVSILTAIVMKTRSGAKSE